MDTIPMRRIHLEHSMKRVPRLLRVFYLPVALSTMMRARRLVFSTHATIAGRAGKFLHLITVRVSVWPLVNCRHELLQQKQGVL